MTRRPNIERYLNTYKIVRYFAADGKPAQIIERGLSLERARAHCNDPETSSATCTTAEGKRRTRRHGDWFDGYTRED